MKVKFNTNNIYKNQLLKRGLEFAANKGALFNAATTLAFSTCIRPLSILAAPKTDQDNKKLACAKSLASSVVGFGLTYGASHPISSAIEKIDEAPDKFLKPVTIKNLKDKGTPLIKSKAYKLATQFFKLGIGTVIAAPKAILTCLLVPPIMSLVFNKKPLKQSQPHSNENIEPHIDIIQSHTDMIPHHIEEKEDLKYNINKHHNINQQQTFTAFVKSARGNQDQQQIMNNNKYESNSPNFKGRFDSLAKQLGKVIDKEGTQNAANKLKNTNFTMHILALTDSITTLTFAHQVKQNKKIEEDRKKPLIYNAVLSTGMNVICSYAVDKALDKPTEKFIKKFSEANKNSPKLDKYIEGIRIAKPALIMGTVYYGIIPLISTFLAERLDNKTNNKKK